MDEREFFDKLAPEWDNNEILSTPQKVAEILEYMELQPGMSVLDLGTGTGVLLPYIADKTGAEGRITAVDYSEGMLSRAKQKYQELTPKPKFLRVDFEEENIDGEYDRIILYSVYPHLHEPIDTLKWLMKVNLKENGKVFIAFPCSEQFINRIHKERKSESDMLPSASQLADYFKANGLRAEVKAENSGAYVVELRKIKEWS